MKVRAVTTAALTETGFDPAGVKDARMGPVAAKECALRNGEILIARSNTPELVGRAALYPGEPHSVVASDLTIRVWVGGTNSPNYIAAFLSYLYTKGYWRERSGGASGSMKKITRTELLTTKIPVPSPEIQHSIATSLSRNLLGARDLYRVLSEQHKLIKILPDALLRRVFSGEV